MFWYFVRTFDWELSKMAIFSFSCQFSNSKKSTLCSWNLFLMEYWIGEQLLLMKLTTSFICEHGLFCENMPSFWQLSFKHFYKITKNIFECLFVCSADMPQRRRMPSIPYGLQSTSLSHLLRDLACRQDQYRFFSWIGLPLYRIIIANYKPREACNNRLTPSYASVCSHYGKRSCRRLLLAHVYNRLTTTVTATTARQYGRKSCY